MENTALGFIAGHTGDMIEAILKNKGVNCDFLRLENGFTRINVKIKSDTETDINGQGPKIDEAAMSCLFEKIDKLCDGDTLILAGSVPSALPKTLYADILSHLKDKNIFTVIDAEGELLTNTLAQNPDLIKPNNIELGEIFKRELKSEDEIIECAKELQNMGAKNVLVSLGKDGAVLVTENREILKSDAPNGQPVNTTGAGDSMVAGFIAGLEKGDYAYALKLGICAGSATASSTTDGILPS